MISKAVELAIVADLKVGFPQQLVAKRNGISRPTVSAIAQLYRLSEDDPPEFRKVPVYTCDGQDGDGQDGELHRPADMIVKPCRACWGERWWRRAHKQK